MYAYYATKDNEDSPFEEPVDFEKLTPKQIIKLRGNTDKYIRYQSAMGLRPDIAKFSEEGQKEYTRLLFGPTMDANFKLTTDKGVPATLLGSRIFKIDSKGRVKEIESDKRANVFKKDAPVFVEGMEKPGTGQYGPGLFSVSIGGEQYLIEGDNDLVDANRFINAAYTYDKPHAAGVGEYFRIRGYNDDETFKVVDQWNDVDGRMGKDPNDIWMHVVDNIITGNLEVVAYYANPKNSKKEWRQPYDPESNPKGYISYPVEGLGRDEAPDPMQLRDVAEYVYELASARKKE
jgi:hypothetical protein